MRKLGRELFYFGIAGTIGYLVDVAVLYLVMETLGLYVGRVLSFLMAATTTWLFNRAITFSNRPSGISLAAEYRSYLLFMLGGALVNYGAYVAALQSVDGMPPYLAVALGSLSGMLVNFLLSRKLLFKNQL